MRRSVLMLLICVGLVTVGALPAHTKSGLDGKAKTACERAAAQANSSAVTPALARTIANIFQSSSTSGAKGQAKAILRAKKSAATELNDAVRWCVGLGYVPSGEPIKRQVASVLGAVDRVLTVAGDPVNDLGALANLLSACNSAASTITANGDSIAVGSAFYANSDEIITAMGDLLKPVTANECAVRPLGAIASLELARARFVAALADIPDLNIS